MKQAEAYRQRRKVSIENWIYVAVAVGHLLSCSWQLKSVPKKWYEKDRKEVWKKFKHFLEDIRCCQKKVHPPRNIFKSVLKRRVKKQKELKGGPKKSAQKSPVTFQITQNGDNESSFP